MQKKVFDKLMSQVKDENTTYHVDGLKVFKWSVIPTSYFTSLAKKHLPKYSKILDIGSGSGDISLHLSAYGYHVLGVDASRPSIDIARQKQSLFDAKTNTEEFLNKIGKIGDDSNFKNVGYLKKKDLPPLVGDLRFVQNYLNPLTAGVPLLNILKDEGFDAIVMSTVLNNFPIIYTLPLAAYITKLGGKIFIGERLHTDLNRVAVEAEHYSDTHKLYTKLSLTNNDHYEFEPTVPGYIHYNNEQITPLFRVFDALGLAKIDNKSGKDGKVIVLTKVKEIDLETLAERLEPLYEKALPINLRNEITSRAKK